MKKFLPQFSRSDGQVMLLAIIMSAILLTLISGLVGYWMSQVGHHRQAIGRAQALSIAEAGVEMALWKLNNQPGYTGETGTAYASGTYNVTITNLGSTSKLIKADAYIPNATSPKAKRSVQVTTTIGTTNIGFNYGLHVGNGGLEMTNSSTVIGNVYSNGNIVGIDSARIQGTAIAAGTSYIDGIDIDVNAQARTIRNGAVILGNATASTLQNSTIGGNVVADTISSCTIGGSATYDTRTSCTVNGTSTTPNPDAYAAAPALPMPITEEQIDIWEQDALAGGTLGTQTFDSGTRNMGPVKIIGNLILSNTAEIVVTGTIWVTGEIKMTNNTILRLSPVYGSFSGIVMAGIDESSVGGYIEIDNSTQILGSGTAGSYLMLLSQREGTGNIAINNKNSGSAAILYAGEGAIEISNFAAMKEITAERLKISNNATITYETGLANAAFSSGPGGGWEIQDGTWQLIQ
jgi:hypothetical protein